MKRWIFTGIILLTGFPLFSQEPEELLRSSIRIKLPTETPELPEIQVNRRLFQKEMILKQFLGEVPPKIEEGSIEVYTGKNGQEVDFYPTQVFSFLQPIQPEEEKKTMNEAEARKAVNDFLEKFGGLPAEAYLLESKALRGEGGAGNLYYYIYAHNYHNVAVETDVIRLTAGAGRVVEFVFGWSTPVKEFPSVKIIPAEAGLKNALKYLYVDILKNKYYATAEVTDVKLYYYNKSQKEIERLVPVWRFTMVLTGQSLLQPGQTQFREPEAIGYSIQVRINAITGDPIR